MVGRRFRSGLAGIAFVIALSASSAVAGGQALPSPTPSARADENASILKPLAEIGRVRARTPFCGALARARAGIDAAITFEYSTPILANDLRNFRLDSYLTRAKSIDKTQRDLTGLWNLAVAGRDDVRALRDAANAAGVDEEQRKAMLGFANALDGAKARQMMLAKSMARVYARLAETPIRDVANTAKDDHGSTGLTTKFGTTPQAAENAVAPKTYTATQADAIEDHEHLQQLFGAFAAERFIREDLKDAAQHGNAAMQLGGCSGI